MATISFDLPDGLRDRILAALRRRFPQGPAETDRAYVQRMAATIFKQKIIDIEEFADGVLVGPPRAARIARRQSDFGGIA